MRSVLAGLSDETKHGLITLEPLDLRVWQFPSNERLTAMMRYDVMLSGTKRGFDRRRNEK